MAGAKKRVVITGIGVVSPLGASLEEFWRGLVEGKSAVSAIESFDTASYRAKNGCEVKDFDFARLAGSPVPPNMGRASQMAVGAAGLAVADAALPLSEVDRTRVGVSLGTTCGEIQVLERVADNEVHPQAGCEAAPSWWLSVYPACSIPASVAHWFGLCGPNVMIPNACAAGNYSIAYACDLIKLGRADIMLAGGADPISRVAFTGFARLGSLAPERCQPFDKNRRGIMIGEGAGVLVLEELRHARARGARIYAEIAGCGVTGDGYHMTAPRGDGEGIARAMALALREAGLAPRDVDYINAHGTGTVVNDKVETLAIKKTFGCWAQDLAISSIKSMIGHTLGAASAIEAAACTLAIVNGELPPTINYETPDPSCDLDYVPNVSRRRAIDVALNNAVAFAGANSCLVIERVQ